MLMKQTTQAHCKPQPHHGDTRQPSVRRATVRLSGTMRARFKSRRVRLTHCAHEQTGAPERTTGQKHDGDGCTKSFFKYLEHLGWG